MFTKHTVMARIKLQLGLGLVIALALAVIHGFYPVCNTDIDMAFLSLCLLPALCWNGCTNR